MISIVIPVYNEEENVEPLYEKITAVMREFGEPYEVIFSDNNSTDHTVERLKRLPRVIILCLARNYGQTSSLDAAIHAAQGDIIITMDGDGQNDPADIPALVSKLDEGYDVVSGWRQHRQDSYGRRLLSRLANWLTGKVTGLHLNDFGCALKAFRREVLEPVHLYGEMHVFLPAYLYMLGAKVAEIPVHHYTRQSGVSKTYFSKVAKNLFDLLTIKFLGGVGDRPLVFFGGVGSLTLLLGFVTMLASVYLKLAHLRNFGQTPLPLLATLLVLSGIIFFMIGFLAELMLRFYYETSNRTPYVIKEKITRLSH